MSKMERNAVSEEEFVIDAIYKDGYFLSDKKTATRGVLVKKVFLKNSQILQEIIYPVLESLFNKVVDPQDLLEVFKNNTYFEEHLGTAASSDTIRLVSASNMILFFPILMRMFKKRLSLKLIM